MKANRATADVFSLELKDYEKKVRCGGICIFNNLILNPIDLAHKRPPKLNSLLNYTYSFNLAQVFISFAASTLTLCPSELFQVETLQKEVKEANAKILTLTTSDESTAKEVAELRLVGSSFEFVDCSIYSNVEMFIVIKQGNRF